MISKTAQDLIFVKIAAKSPLHDLLKHYRAQGKDEAFISELKSELIKAHNQGGAALNSFYDKHNWDQDNARPKAGPRPNPNRNTTNNNAGPKAGGQKPGNPFNAGNFKSQDYDPNYWEARRKERWKNFHAEADRMKADFEAKFKAQQQAKPKWDFHKADPEFVKNMGNNAQKDYMRKARRGMVGLGLAGAAYGVYKLYDYYKNQNKKDV